MKVIYIPVRIPVNLRTFAALLLCLLAGLLSIAAVATDSWTTMEVRCEGNDVLNSRAVSGMVAFQGLQAIDAYTCRLRHQYQRELCHSWVTHVYSQCDEADANSYDDPYCTGSRAFHFAFGCGIVGGILAILSVFIGFIKELHHGPVAGIATFFLALGVVSFAVGFHQMTGHNGVISEMVYESEHADNTTGEWFARRTRMPQGIPQNPMRRHSRTLGGNGAASSSSVSQGDSGSSSSGWSTSSGSGSSSSSSDGWSSESSWGSSGWSSDSSSSDFSNDASRLDVHCQSKYSVGRSFDAYFVGLVLMIIASTLSISLRYCAAHGSDNRALEAPKITVVNIDAPSTTIISHTAFRPGFVQLGREDRPVSQRGDEDGDEDIELSIRRATGQFSGPLPTASREAPPLSTQDPATVAPQSDIVEVDPELLVDVADEYEGNGERKHETLP